MIDHPYKKALELSQSIRETGRPNSLSIEYDFEEVIGFATEVERILLNNNSRDLHRRLQVLMAATPEVDIDPANEAR